MQSLDPHYVLVIAEKPDAARRIAGALGTVIRKEIYGTEYLEVKSSFNGIRYVVCSASGHLYGLGDPGENRRVFPVFDVDWFALPYPVGAKISRKGNKYRANPKSINSNSRRKTHAITSLSRSASQFVHACDYDLEGETIGANILRFACNLDSQSSVKRAKFSTLAESEIREAFSNLQPPDRNLSNAGRMRHLIDFVWGVNVSRALTETVRTATGEFQMLTVGRVQGPTLCYVAKREIEVMAHVPIPFWTITCALDKDGTSFVARYEISRIKTIKDAQSVYEQVSLAKVAKVVSLNAETRLEPPPFPFNTGELQKEAFRIHRISPSVTLKTAERLYLRALISYPRTDSQKLPPSIGYTRIFDGLSKIDRLKPLLEVVKQERRGNPRQGPRDDPAHPAIFPTGENPKSLSGLETQIFDLIARRFLAAFAGDASLIISEAVFDISSHKFLTAGEKLQTEGWTKIYPFYRAEKPENTLPNIAVSDILRVLRADMLSKYDEQPPRYTEYSLISKMDSDRIGTKSTRAEIVATLVLREYITNGSSLRPTDIGMTLISSMSKYCPELIAPEMTQRLEKDIESISQGEITPLAIFGEAMNSLVDVLEKILENQRQIGLEFHDFPKVKSHERQHRQRDSNPRLVSVGKCPICDSGDLRIIKSLKTGKRFLGCSNYKNGCRASAPLPQKGLISTSSQKCKICKWPEMTLLFRVYHSKNGSKFRPWNFCPNPNCPSKTQSQH